MKKVDTETAKAPPEKQPLLALVPNSIASIILFSQSKRIDKERVMNEIKKVGKLKILKVDLF